MSQDRNSPRYRFQDAGQLKDIRVASNEHGPLFKGMIKDISDTGLCIVFSRDSQAKFNSGDFVWLHLSAFGNQDLKTKAKIIYVQTVDSELQIGVQYQDFPRVYQERFRDNINIAISYREHAPTESNELEHKPPWKRVALGLATVALVGLFTYLAVFGLKKRASFSAG